MKLKCVPCDLAYIPLTLVRCAYETEMRALRFSLYSIDFDALCL